MLPESKMTFKELTEWYLALNKVKEIKSFWRIKIALENFNFHFGDTLLSDFKPVDIENYQIKRKEEGIAAGTIDKEVKTVHAVVNKAFDNDKVSGAVLKVFKEVKNLLRKNENARNKVLALDQFNRLLSCLPFHSRAIVATGFYTGMRLGEIIELTWDKVDLKKRFINLEAKDTKDNEPRSIPICAELGAILETIPKGIHDNHVFLYKGKPVRDIRASLKRGCKNAGILYGHYIKDGFVFHDLRHTFNINMRKAGVPESVIMKITGHSTREMFDRYNTVDEEDAKNAVSKLHYFLTSVD